MVKRELSGGLSEAKRGLRKTSGLLSLIILFSLSGAMVLSLSACDRGDNSLTAGERNGDVPGGDQPDEKIDPDKIVEARRPLLLQQPTHVEDKFLNEMQLEFGEFLQAAYTFTFVPEKAGSLYFSNIQSRVYLEGCTEDITKRVVTYNVVWQEDLGVKGRKRLKQFKPDITEYTFEAGKKYMLTFALVKLREELADCKSATVKFAVFQQNYAKDPK